jgi:hypothetical protein
MDVNDNITPVQSFNEDLGVSVSQQMREKIINGEYVDLETLLVSIHTEQSRAVVIDSSGNLNLKQKV